MCVRNIIDCREADVRFDGITRVTAISSRKLLIILENGNMQIMTLIFDQAEIDVADALFTKINCDQSILASSVIYILINSIIDLFSRTPY
jgi:hypothetical protein